MYIPESLTDALQSKYAWDKTSYGMWSIKGRAVAVCDLSIHLTVGSCRVVVNALVHTVRAVGSFACIIVSFPVKGALPYMISRLSPERVNNLHKIFDVKTNKTDFKNACASAIGDTLAILVIRVGMVVANVIGIGFPDIARLVRTRFVKFNEGPAPSKKQGTPEPGSPIPAGSREVKRGITEDKNQTGGYKEVENAMKEAGVSPDKCRQIIKQVRAQDPTQMDKMENELGELTEEEKEQLDELVQEIMVLAMQGYLPPYWLKQEDFLNPVLFAKKALAHIRTGAALDREENEGTASNVKENNNVDPSVVTNPATIDLDQLIDDAFEEMEEGNSSSAPQKAFSQEKRETQVSQGVELVGADTLKWVQIVQDLMERKQASPEALLQIMPLHEKIDEMGRRDTLPPDLVRKFGKDDKALIEKLLDFVMETKGKGSVEECIQYLIRS